MNRYDEALEVLLPLYDPAKYNSRTLARIAHNIANAYYLLGDVEQHQYWLATAGDPPVTCKTPFSASESNFPL